MRRETRMDTCPGCEWCRAGRLPDFEDDEALMDFVTLHPGLAFDGVRPVSPSLRLSSRARARALEAAERLRQAQPVQDVGNLARPFSTQLVRVFAEDLLEAAI